MNVQFGNYGKMKIDNKMPNTFFDCSFEHNYPMVFKTNGTKN